jgi:hypothetical protein
MDETNMLNYIYIRSQLGHINLIPNQTIFRSYFGAAPFVGKQHIYHVKLSLLDEIGN